MKGPSLFSSALDYWLQVNQRPRFVITYLQYLINLAGSDSGFKGGRMIILAGEGRNRGLFACGSPVHRYGKPGSCTFAAFVEAEFWSETLASHLQYRSLTAILRRGFRLPIVFEGGRDAKA